MIIHERKYIKPSKVARELSILENLAGNSSISQSELGKASFLSGAMVNQYLRDMRKQGLIDFVKTNGKTYKYILTDKGEQQRSSMFAVYSSELVQLYASLKQVIKDKITSVLESGENKIALYGAAETCEVSYSALSETSLEVVAVVDGSKHKHGRKFHGLIISPPEILEIISCHAVVITTFAHQREIMKSLAPLAQQKDFKLISL